jgi:DNA-binding CsgD family transcriptional regulator
MPHDPPRVDLLKALIAEIGEDGLAALEVHAIKFRPVPDRLIRDIVRGSPLYPQEVRVLSMYASGLKRGEVARELGITPWTVHHHAREARHKLGARTVHQAVAIAVETGILRAA